MGGTRSQGRGAALPSDSVFQPLMFLTAIAVTAAAAKRGSGRETRIDREVAVAFGVVCAVLVVASVVAQGELLPYRGVAVVWAFGIAQALLIVGLLGSRVLALGAPGRRWLPPGGQELRRAAAAE